MNAPIRIALATLALIATPALAMPAAMPRANFWSPITTVWPALLPPLNFTT